jgi:hypothetical protein
VVTPENSVGGETLVRAKDTFLILPAVGASGKNFFEPGAPPQIIRRNIVPWITPLLREN